MSLSENPGLQSIADVILEITYNQSNRKKYQKKPEHGEVMHMYKRKNLVNPSIQNGVSSSTS